jgi:hypothetical protein
MAAGIPFEGRRLAEFAGLPWGSIQANAASSQSVLRDSLLRRTVAHTGDCQSSGKRRRVKQERRFFGTLPTGDGNAVSTSAMSLRIGAKQAGVNPKSNNKSKSPRQALTYRHPETALGPEVGTQAQFKKRKPRVTYYHDPSRALGWLAGIADAKRVTR